MFKRLKYITNKMNQWRLDFLKNNRPLTPEQRIQWNENCRVSAEYDGAIALTKDDFDEIFTDNTMLQIQLSDIITILKCLDTDYKIIKYGNGDGKLLTTKGEFNLDKLIDDIKMIKQKLKNESNNNLNFYKLKMRG